MDGIGWDLGVWLNAIIWIGSVYIYKIKERLKCHGKRWEGKGRGFIEEHTHGSETQSLLFQYDDER